jgi:spore germination cell wall hydrolase CwlJ-like protein
MIVGSLYLLASTVFPASLQAATPSAGLPFGDTAEGLRVAAITVWGEARGETHRGRLAVANIIRNRLVESRLWYQRTGKPHPVYGPGTLAGICRAPYQFSVWLKNDPNYPKLSQAPRHSLYPDCMKAVVAALNGTEPSPIGLANHYFDSGKIPAWARGRKPVAVIGSHTFYRI